MKYLVPEGSDLVHGLIVWWIHNVMTLWECDEIEVADPSWRRWVAGRVFLKAVSCPGSFLFLF